MIIVNFSFQRSKKQLSRMKISCCLRLKTRQVSTVDVSHCLEPFAIDFWNYTLMIFLSKSYVKSCSVVLKFQSPGAEELSMFIKNSRRCVKKIAFLNNTALLLCEICFAGHSEKPTQLKSLQSTGICS